MTMVETRAVTGGVDTRADVHVAAALDPAGGLLGVGEFPASPAGYARLLGWLGGFGAVALVGIEGTGSSSTKHFATEVMACLDVLTMPGGPARCGGLTGMPS